MPPVEQVRERTFIQGQSTTFIKDGAVETNYNTVFGGRQLGSNNPHRWPPRGANKDADIGGSFFHQTAKWNEIGGAYTSVRLVDNSRKYQGMTYPWYSGGILSLGPCPTLRSDGELDAFGTTAIARTLPTAPKVSVGQFIGELRDLPRFAVETWKARTKGFMALAKGGSKDYLNAQFGWKPFVDDIMKFTDVTKSATKHIDQYLRDSGKTVRRRTNPKRLTSTTTELVTNSWYGVPAVSALLVQSAGQVRKTTVVVQETWFSGAYKYYVPTDGELLDPKTGRVNLQKVAQQSEQLANRLYGTRITPHLLWQLAPWSWAVDWVTNAGDVVKNLTYLSSDNLVLKYGYVMSRSVVTELYEVTRPLVLANGRHVRSTQVISYTTLQRRRATPYGFGLTPGSFSARQWSIIAALGISKAPYSLKF